MSRQLLCPYSENCEIYQGKKPIQQPSLMIYKNVFCKRGEKGWSNCKYYVELKTNNQQ